MNSPKHSTEYISAINVKQTSEEVYKFNFSTNNDREKK